MADLTEFWIDVGGTFTDCLMKSPEGRLSTYKVLSSGITKGQVTAVIDQRTLRDEVRTGDAARFWVGYTLTLLDDTGDAMQTARVTAFDSASGTFTLDEPLVQSAVVNVGQTFDSRRASSSAPQPSTLNSQPLRYELSSGEEAPILAIRTALGLRLDEAIPPVIVRLGTTRGTNALLTRRGARVGFVTTKGFRDVLLIANQDRPRLFDLAIQKPEPLFAAVAEIDERLDATGSVLLAPNEAAVRERLLELKSARCESLAICLLHAFANSAHELLVERIAREVGFTEISTSSRLAPLIKIVSRGDTTVMDAYVNPILRDYVGKLRASLDNSARPAGTVVPSPPSSGERARVRGTSGDTTRQFEQASSSGLQPSTIHHQPLSESPPHPNPLPPKVGGEVIGEVATAVTTSAPQPSTLHPQTALKLMTSAGGLVDADRFTGKDSVLSGPAGGVIGFSRVAQRAGFAKSIGFDMGGTSTDVSRFDGRYEREFETTKAGVRVVAPMLAIETVAAGGGSVCGFDGVKLYVGPQSAGANPGPACYGRGGPLTITDVNFFLGKIIPDRFPFPLDRAAVETRLFELCDRVAKSPLGRTYSPHELAQGFIDIANTTMARAIRKISVSKGYDPAEYALVTFGGAGAQHACALALSLGMTTVLSHPYSGVLSAYGIGLADVRQLRERGVLKPFSSDVLAELKPHFVEMANSAREDVLAEGIPLNRIDAPIRSLDLRYRGIEASLNVIEPNDRDYARAYAERHQQLYGYTRHDRPLEVVAARIEVVGHRDDPDDMPASSVSGTALAVAPHSWTEAWFHGEPHRTAVFLREQLHPGNHFAGPAIVCEPTSTVVIDPGFVAAIRGRGEIVIARPAGTVVPSPPSSGERVRVRGPSSDETLTRLGFVTDADMKSLTESYRPPEYVDLDTIELDPNTLQLLTPEQAIEYKAVPIELTDDERLRIAFCLEPSWDVIDKLRFTLNREIVPVIASKESIGRAIGRIYSSINQSHIESPPHPNPLPPKAGGEGTRDADPIRIEIFNHLFASIAEQMGIALQQTSLSTNVKERLDFSCGIFSARGELVVNAPHIPVHLGAMSETVRRIIEDNPGLKPGDVFVTNDPYRGGSHLPDVTVVTPVHDETTGELMFFTASRAHHAEIGGIVPGSMPPFSKTLADEGVLIRNFLLISGPLAPRLGGARARVRGLSGGDAAPLQTGSSPPPSPRRGGSGRENDERGMPDSQSSPLPNPSHQGEGTRPAAASRSAPQPSTAPAQPSSEISPHPNPLPPKAGGEGTREDALRDLLTSGPWPSRSPDDNLADVSAQVAANQTGATQLRQLVEKQSWPVVRAYMGHIQASAAAKMRLALSSMPNGQYARTDHLDDGSPICVTITIEGDRAIVDFTGTGPVLATNLNANRAIVTAAVLYVFRCLIQDDIPLNSGVLEPVTIVLPECLLNPPAHEDPSQCAAMVGGNVETSQRVVDVLLGALGVAAASQGTMNNLTFGDGTFGYYETICGGSGATPEADGADAVHTHMTNTRLTDPEVIERRYPVRIHEFSIRRGSGGAGAHRGGNGIVRKIEFLKPLKVSLLTERRGPFAPFGLNGGAPGQLGHNTLQRAGQAETIDLGGKVSLDVQPGDVLRIETPGGGGYGPEEKTWVNASLKQDKQQAIEGSPIVE